jgi:aminoglycoside phosphotransferase (APT) family kinase protein
MSTEVLTSPLMNPQSTVALNAGIELRRLYGSIDHRRAVIKNPDLSPSERAGYQTDIEQLEQGKTLAEFALRIGGKSAEELDQSIIGRKRQKLKNDTSEKLANELQLLRARKRELTRLKKKPSLGSIQASIDHRNTLIAKRSDSDISQQEVTSLQTEITILELRRAELEALGTTVTICENHNQKSEFSPTAGKPSATLSEQAEIKRYKNLHSREYRQLVTTMADLAGIVIDQDTRIVLALPAYKEGKNIIRSLESYASQSAMHQAAILIFDNRPEGTKPDATEQIVRKFMTQHPDLKIGYIKAQFAEQARNIGNIRKVANDVMVELIDRRNESHPGQNFDQIYMISNDADPGMEGNDQAPYRSDYFKTIINYFDNPQNQQVDAIAGKIDFPADVLSRVPKMLVARRFWQYLDIVKKWKREKTKGMTHLVGRNSAWRVASYCAIGGYNAEATCGEDTHIGSSIFKIRGEDPRSIRYHNQAVVYTDPRRDLMQIAENKPLAYQYSDFKGSDALRDLPTPFILERAESDRITDEEIQEELQAMWYAFGKRDDPSIFLKATEMLGVDGHIYEDPQNKGHRKFMVDNTDRLRKYMKEQMFRELFAKQIVPEIGVIRSFAAVGHNQSNFAYILEMEDGRKLIARASRDSRSRSAESKFKREQRLYHKLREQGLPTPEVTHIISSSDSSPYAIQISHYIDHDSSIPEFDELANQPEKLMLTRKAGEALRRIHNIQTSGYGELAQSNTASREHDSWHKVMHAYDAGPLFKSLVSRQGITTVEDGPEINHRFMVKTVEELQDAREYRVNNPSSKHNYEIQQIDARLAQLKSLKSLISGAQEVLVDHKQEFSEFDDPRLLHNDFNHANVLIKNGGIAAIIDIEHPISGDPMYELAHYAFIYEDHQDLAPFFEGYGLTREEYTSQEFWRKIRLYQIRIGMDLLWWQSTGKQDHAETRDILLKLNRAVRYFS